MRDFEADTLIEAVILELEFLRSITLYVIAPGPQFDWHEIETRSRKMLERLEELQKARTGRSDDEPAR